MITHLAMNSHPNPEKVLVIGGGDGGVLREVVKHDCVKEATLCDIDEAVIRLSKQYLPGMSVGFEHPKTTTIVGDGFKFLEDKKGEFDVIITDSSDPEGPAEALFQKSYFELLNGALREGGVITTQGCKPSPCPLVTSSLFEDLHAPGRCCSGQWLTFPCSREPMASHAPHCQPQEGLQGGLPQRRVRLHHYPYLPLRSNRLHGLQQGRQPRPQEAPPQLVHRGGGATLQVLQQGDPRGSFLSAYFRSQGSPISVSLVEFLFVTTSLDTTICDEYQKTVKSCTFTQQYFKTSSQLRATIFSPTSTRLNFY